MHSDMTWLGTHSVVVLWIYYWPSHRGNYLSVYPQLADEILLLEEGIISRRISKESFDNLHEELKQELLTNQLSHLQI